MLAVTVYAGEGLTWGSNGLPCSGQQLPCFLPKNSLFGPPVVWAFAVYSTFPSRFITPSFFKSGGGSVARTLAAIDVNGLARHEARRFQIEDGNFHFCTWKWV
jgi:hypothetical protein